MRYNRLYESNNFIVTTDYTQTLCDYAENFNLSSVPPAVIEKAKQILVHTIGSVYAAKDMTEAQRIRALGLQANGGEGGKITNWGTGEKMSAINASMVTGALADMLEWTDCTGTGHPAAAVAPLAWMIAEETGKGGKEVLRGMILAYDVAQRIAKAVFPGERGKKCGFGMTSWQMFYAFIAAGSVYGFNAREYDLGIGTVCENSTIPALYHLTTMSECGHYEFGFRNKDGLFCAKAVVKGLNNGRDALDEDKCYRGAISDEPKPEYFKAGLGESYEILNSVLRKWPADMWTQAAASAVSELCAEYHITADDIDEVIIDPGVNGMMDLPVERYESITHAQNNIPFVVASVILGVAPGAAWYTHERLADPTILALARKVHSGNSVLLEPVDCYENLAFNGSVSVVTVMIRTVEGREFTCKCDRIVACDSREEVSSQFLQQVAPILGEEKAKKSLDVLFNIEQYENIADLSWIVGANQ